MLETPEARARLRRKLELCPDWKRSPVSINAGFELLDMVERQEKMIDWLIGKITDFCVRLDSCADCPGATSCSKSTPLFKESWREAARRAVEGK